MTSKVKHSKKLSKRFRKDPNFSSTLYPQPKKVIELEKGILELKDFKEQESTFSEITPIDTDEEIELYTNIERNSAMLSVQRFYKANQAIESTRRLKKSKWNNKTLVFKAFNLKRNPNPITEIRFLDYVFYLDSDMFLDTNYKTTKEFTGLPQTIYNHKRASSVIFDKKKQCFVIKMHEKETENERNFSSGAKFNYYMDWLQSMGNTKAMYLIEIFQQLKQSNEDRIKKIPQYASQYSEVISKTDPIFFIKSIDEKTKKYILEQPYYSRTFKIDLFTKTENTGLIEEEYHMDYVKMMGYQESDMDELLLSFLRLNIQKSSYVKSIYNNILDGSQRLIKKLDTKVDPTQTTCVVVSEKFITKDKYGEDGYARGLHIYDERWFENRSLYIKTYAIPVDIKYFKNC